MPNYVTNRIDLVGPDESIQNLIKSLKSNDYEIDFNKIIPMPESLMIDAGSMEDQSIAVYNYKEKGDDKKLREIFSYPWVKDEGIKSIDELCDYFIREDPKIIDRGRTYIENLEKYGATTWYDWCYENWNTKWNACDPWVDRTAFGFQTAWSDVTKLMVVVSERFPDVEMHYDWADEDFGCNLGRITIKNGKIIKKYLPEEQTDDAYALATEILGYDAREDWDEEDDW